MLNNYIDVEEDEFEDLEFLEEELEEEFEGLEFEGLEEDFEEEEFEEEFEGLKEDNVLDGVNDAVFECVHPSKSSKLKFLFEKPQLSLVIFHLQGCFLLFSI